MGERGGAALERDVRTTEGIANPSDRVMGKSVVTRLNAIGATTESFSNAMSAKANEASETEHRPIVTCRRAFERSRRII
jgi:hypothetical protein